MPVTLLFKEIDTVIFASKNAKNNLKKKLKKMYSEDPKSFIDNVNKMRSELIEKYVRPDQFVVQDFNVKVADGDIITVTFSQVENKTETNRMKLREKLKQLKNERYYLSNKKVVAKEWRKLKKDPRVDKEMIDKYHKACMSVDFDFPNPSEILDDLDSIKVEFREYLRNILNKNTSPEMKDYLLNDAYTKYMSHITGVGLPNKS